MIAFSDGGGDIYLVNVDGGVPTKLFNSHRRCGDYEPEWSPDGRTIAFRQSGICKHGIYLISSHGGTPERLTQGSGDSQPAWSPDGANDRVFRGDGPGENIYLIDVSTGETSQLTEEPDNYMPSWSPDGEQIVFGSNRTGEQNLWLMNAGRNRREATHLRPPE